MFISCILKIHHLHLNDLIIIDMKGIWKLKKGSADTEDTIQTTYLLRSCPRPLFNYKTR